MFVIHQSSVFFPIAADFTLITTPQALFMFTQSAGSANKLAGKSPDERKYGGQYIGQGLKGAWFIGTFTF